MSSNLLSPSLPRFSDEIILEIFEHLTDAELLSLATISKHIHDLALLECLSRYGITETDVAANSFPQLSTGGAFRALQVARFITGVDALRLRFDPTTKLSLDIAALNSLVRRLRPIKSIDLEFSQWPKTRTGAGCDIEGLLLSLISSYRSRPTITVSPLAVAIVRPRKPALYPLRQLYGRLRSLASKAYVRTEPMIDEVKFREGLVIFTLLRLGGQIPSVSIRAFDAPAPVGTLIVLRAVGVSNLRILPNVRMSPDEISALFANLKLPLLRNVDVALSDIAQPALCAFLCGHPTLQGLRLRGPPPTPPSAAPPVPLPSDALPQLEHILGSARLLAWVLGSPHPFPQLVVATLELHAAPAPGPRDDYRDALRGLARRSAADTLALQLKGWAPWDAPDFFADTAPERALVHVSDLRLTFRRPSRVPRGTTLVKWLQMFAVSSGNCDDNRVELERHDRQQEYELSPDDHNLGPLAC
ncbi:hypothetical protein B0H19DRAFT_1374934 [Mycena capillaripes]|nr:hypothetical protein B0H19DRAFT_1374934 [Mycena capillaripes]